MTCFIKTVTRVVLCLSALGGGGGGRVAGGNFGAGALCDSFLTHYGSLFSPLNSGAARPTCGAVCFAFFLSLFSPRTDVRAARKRGQPNSPPTPTHHHHHHPRHPRLDNDNARHNRRLSMRGAVNALAGLAMPF